jgi:hypothetical protein
MPDGKATIMRDTVRYAVGFGRFGAVAARTFVHRDVASIFDFRRDAVVPALAALSAGVGDGAMRGPSASRGR